MTNEFLFELEIFLRRLSEMDGDVKKLHSAEISEFAIAVAEQLETVNDQNETPQSMGWVGGDGLP